MPHVSKHRIEDKIFKEIQGHFAILLARVKKQNEIHVIFNDLLTKTERIMVAKRLAIILMLENGYSFRKISRRLKVSESTISAMRERFDRKSGGFEKIIDYFTPSQRSKKIDQAVTKIIRLFSMPPYAGPGRWKSVEELQEDQRR